MDPGGPSRSPASESPRRSSGSLAGGAPAASASSPTPTADAGWFGDTRRSFKRAINKMLPGTAAPPATTAPSSAPSTPTAVIRPARRIPSPPRPRRNPAGLANVGDTCYFNSVMQVLYHLKVFFRNLLLFRRHAPDVDDGGVEADIVAGMYNTFHALDNPGPYGSIDPSELVDVLRDPSREARFEADGQQDAHEFLRYVVDVTDFVFKKAAQIQRELGAPASDLGKEDLPVSDVDSSASAGTKRNSEGTSDSPRPAKKAKIPVFEEEELDAWDMPPPPPPAAAAASANASSSSKAEKKRPLDSPNASPGSPSKRPRSASATWDPDAIRNIFGGEMVTVTRCCQCETRSLRPEPFLDLSVPVAVGRSLSGSLSAMTAGDLLVGRDKYQCDSCQTKTEAERRLYLSKLPPILTIHLKLFQMTATMEGAKIPVSTPCPMRMRFNRWCTKECAETAPEYELSAVIVHAGGCSTSGHYFAYIRVPEHNRWFLFDDSSVTAVDEEEIKAALFSSVKSKKTGYLLFYSAIEDN